MSGKRREAEELARQRIQDTGKVIAGSEVPAGTGIFASTDRPPIAEEPAPAARPAVRKSRAWDKANPVHSYRIPEEQEQRIKEMASSQGWTRDEVAEGLIGAALEAIDEGRLELAITRETETTTRPVKTRWGTEAIRRIPSVRSRISWQWKSRG